MSLPELHPDAMRPLPATSTSDPDDLDSVEYVTLYKIYQDIISSRHSCTLILSIPGSSGAV